MKFIFLHWLSLLMMMFSTFWIKLMNSMYLLPWLFLHHLPTHYQVKIQKINDPYYKWYSNREDFCRSFCWNIIWYCLPSSVMVSLAFTTSFDPIIWVFVVCTTTDVSNVNCRCRCCQNLILNTKPLPVILFVVWMNIVTIVIFIIIIIPNFFIWDRGEKIKF